MNGSFFSSILRPPRPGSFGGAGFVALAVLTLLGEFAVCLPSLAAAATGAKPALDRYLLVVETSAEMQRCADNMHRIVASLVASGMNGQLREGETLGVWTFNEALHAGGFPLQRWALQSRTRIAADVVGFLTRQALEKQGRLEPVITPIKRLIADSEAITVVLITVGEDKLGGTPFDVEINASYKLNSAAQRKARMPFVTVLRAWKGEFVGWTVNTPPWPLEFPAFPPRPPTEQLATPKAELKPDVPPLIVIGKKPEPAATNAPPVIEPNKEPAPPIVTAQSTNVKTKPAIQEPNPAVAPPTAPAQPPVTTISVTNAGLAQTPPNSVPNAPAPTITTTPDVASPEPKPEPASAAPVSPPVTEPTPKSGKGTSAPVRVTIPQTAVAEPGRNILNRNVILIAGGAMLLVALGLVFAFMRRSRPPERISLITRSMDRDKK